MVEAESFKGRHRWASQAFTRERSVTFSLLLVLVLRNGMKSLQSMVNEALRWLNIPVVTASAYSQARYKLKHTACIELNAKAVVETLYGDGEYRRFQGFREVAIDGSKMVLPDTEDVRGEFGTIAWTGRKDAELQAQRRYAWQDRLWVNRLSMAAAS